MVEDCVIVGAGVAGLSAANQLVDAGLNPLIIETSKFPAHRLCGEFLSYECLPILQHWNIPVAISIEGGRFISGAQHIEFKLPNQSGSCSRYLLDSMLLERAKQKGARILTQTTVLALNMPESSSGYYELVLCNGQTIQSRHLMIGAGRIPGISEMTGVKVTQYVGFKAHFKKISTNKNIEIHTFEGGYLGIANIDDEVANVACIVNKNWVEDLQQPEVFMLKLQESLSLPLFNERMRNACMIFPKWLVGQIPEFGIRKNPSWERVFWIGDAAGSIPPICGEGLALAITSGCMAADYFLKSSAREFKKAWLKKYRQRFLIAKLLHRMMMHPKMAHIAIRVASVLPKIPSLIWRMTR